MNHLQSPHVIIHLPKQAT